MDSKKEGVEKLWNIDRENLIYWDREREGNHEKSSRQWVNLSVTFHDFILITDDDSSVNNKSQAFVNIIIVLING